MENRYSNFISDKLVKKLVPLSKEVEPSILKNQSFNGSLKKTILGNDPAVQINLESSTRFSISENVGGIFCSDGPLLSYGIVNDFLLGSKRVENHHKNVLNMKNASLSSAWLLVSCYYLAFFSTVEINKILGSITFNVGRDDFDLLVGKLDRANQNYQRFLAEKNYNFTGRVQNHRIAFASDGSRPHDAVWLNARTNISRLFQGKNWDDCDIYIKLLEDPDNKLNNIRNLWNYKRSDFFSYIGEGKAKEFNKILSNDARCKGWLQSNRNIPPLDPCSIAVIAEAHANAVIAARKRLVSIIQAKED